MVYYLGPAGSRYDHREVHHRNNVHVGRRGEWMTRGRPVVEVVRVISEDRLVMVRTPDGRESIVNCRDIRWLTGNPNLSSSSSSNSPIYRPTSPAYNPASPAYHPTSPPFGYEPERHPAYDPTIFPEIMRAAGDVASTAASSVEQPVSTDSTAAATNAAASSGNAASVASGSAPSGNAATDSAVTGAAPSGDSATGSLASGAAPSENAGNAVPDNSASGNAASATEHSTAVTAAAATSTADVAAAASKEPSITCCADGNLEVRTSLQKSDLECVVCYEPLVGKVFQCMLGAHNICQNCRDSIRSSGKDVCPMDRTSGGFIPNPRFEKEIATLTKKCKYSACPAKVLPWTMDAHVQVCQFGPFSCPLCQKQVSAAAEAASSDVGYFEQHLQSGQCSAQYQSLQDDQSRSGIKLKLVSESCYYAVDPLNYLLFTPVPLSAGIQALLYQVRALNLSTEPSKGWNSIKLEYLNRADCKSVSFCSSTEVLCWQRGGSSQGGVVPGMLVLPSLETGIKVEFSSIAKFQVGEKIHAVHRDLRQWMEAEVIDVNTHIGEIYVRFNGQDPQSDQYWMSQNSDQIIAPFRGNVNPSDFPDIINIQQQGRRQRYRR